MSGHMHAALVGKVPLLGFAGGDTEVVVRDEDVDGAAAAEFVAGLAVADGLFKQIRIYFDFREAP
jgi:hypothetical protein